MSEERERSAAAAAAEQVRAILEAAERETEQQLRRVGETADRLAARADEIEARLETLAGEIRTAIGELRSELRALRAPAPAPPDAEAAKPAEPEPNAAEQQPEPPSAEQQAEPARNEGARVIALNMALSGSSREETAAYLAENFELEDPESLLDDVYARASR